MWTLALLIPVYCFILEEPCPVDAPCRCYGTKIDCIGKRITVIPEFNFTPAFHRELYIDIRKNAITSLGAHALGNIAEVHNEHLTVDLNDNKISYIDEHAFETIGNTSVSLYLSNNNLSSLPKALMHLANLKELQLLGNTIMYLDDAIMMVIGSSLTSLWLDAGSLAIWPRSLARLTILSELVLEHLPFTSIPATAFDGLYLIERLEIYHSNLRTIPDAICSLDNLQILHFEHNDNVDLNSNRFTPHCSEPMKTVNGLYLSYNHLTDFYPYAVTKNGTFPGLRTLSLSNNNLYDLSDLRESTFQLYYLYLSNNRLSNIPMAVVHMPELLTLILSGNVITEVDDTTLSGLQNLRQLTMIDVPIDNIHPHAFSTSYSLKTLHLENTNLTSIPAAVMHLGDSFNADFSGSPITCTCQNLAFLREFPVADFVDNKKRFRGNCVNADPVKSIQEFVIGMPELCG